MINNRFRQLRHEKGLTMKEVINESNIDVTTSHLGAIERHETSLSIPVLIEFANFYDVSIDYILKLSDNRKTGLSENSKVR